VVGGCKWRLSIGGRQECERLGVDVLSFYPSRHSLRPRRNAAPLTGAAPRWSSPSWAAARTCSTLRGRTRCLRPTTRRWAPGGRVAASMGGDSRLIELNVLCFLRAEEKSKKSAFSQCQHCENPNLQPNLNPNPNPPNSKHQPPNSSTSTRAAPSPPASPPPSTLS